MWMPQIKLDEGDTSLILIDLGRGKKSSGRISLCTSHAEDWQDQTPDVDSAEDLKGFTAIQQLINEDKLLAYHDRSDGGVCSFV